MTNREVKGPSHFCEWVVGTTIESALGPVPKPKKKPKKREVVRVEVTTDDESEEDTVKITYPRTGRNNPHVVKNEAVVKKVRFEDTPKKSALKKPRAPVADSSDETSESGPELASDSSQSGNFSSSSASGSDAENSDNDRKPAKNRKKKSQVSDDTDSDWDSDPHPTCKKKSKEDTPTSTEASGSEIDEAPKATDKKKSGKKGKESESEAETSDSAKDTSDSEPTTPPKKQEQKKGGKKKNTKSEESTTEAETSESEPEPPKAKKQEPKANQKKGGKKTEEPETDGETSESAKETEEESEPETKQKQKNKVKPRTESPKQDDKKKETKREQKPNKQQNKGKQKAGKEPKMEPDEAKDKAEDDEVGESSGQRNKGKSKKGKEKADAEDTAASKSKHKDGVKKGNYPEGLPVPHPRRPQLIEPIRAEVVQTERVVETPEDPAPNAYYDPEHNVVRVYYGPVYGNHQSHALYPDRNAFTKPLPMGIPHPTQNPFYYGFNNPQHHLAFGQNPPYHQNYTAVPPPEGYSHVPITQGMPVPGWRAVSGPPGFPPGPPNGHEAKTNPGAFGKTENPPPPSSKDKDKAGQNNVGPSSQTGAENPYIPRRVRSQFSTYGSRKGEENPSGSARAESNNWNNQTSNEWDNNNNNNNNNNNATGWSNDGAGDNNQQNDQTAWDAAQDTNQNNTWETTNNQNDNNTWGEQAQNTNWDNTWGNNSQQGQDNGQNWSSGSHRSIRTIRRKECDHWGEDTHLGNTSNWDDKKGSVSNQGQGGDNNVVGWDVNGGDNHSNGSKRSGMPADNVMPGSWVDTPSAPAWGDPTAAVDTHGQAVNW
ncbi:hypothetical protein ACJ41O_011222 [Fusarium nematophilum]